MINLKGRKISVLGFGKSGTSVVGIAIRLGAEVLISEEKEVLSFQKEEERLRSQGIGFEFGGHTERILSADLIIVSPGVKMDIPILQQAEKRGIPIISEIEFAWRLLPEVTIIAITGTNGKTTTTQLIHEILKADGKKAFLCGNIGYPLSEVIKEVTKESFIVAEISSFQLEGVKEFRPKVGVLLNITPDHLDRHKDMSNYTSIKSRLFDNQQGDDFMVLNSDDKLTLEAVSGKRGRSIPFSRKKELAEGVFVKGDKICYRLSGFGEGEIIETNEMKMQGFHNLENALAATAVSVVLGVKTEVIRRTLTNFSPPAHRLEDLGEINGVRFINDSKATNVDATLRALESLPENVILIAGGKDKDSNYSSLKEMIHQKAKALILIGEAKEKIASQVGGKIKVYILNTLKEAVDLAFGLAQDGDYILFSPASSSLDQFRNFEERGDTFKRYVNELKNLEGRRL